MFVPIHNYWIARYNHRVLNLSKVDFDGIIAGAPANNQIQLSAWRFALETAALKDPARVVPPAKIAMLNRAVLAACDPRRRVESTPHIGVDAT